jgi:hypothetical protein
MTGTSTARFMAVWALAMAPFSIGSSLLAHVAASSVGAGRLRMQLLQVLFTFVLAVGAGAVQGRLLARLRAPVRAWGLAVALGSLAGSVLSAMAAFPLMRMVHALPPALASWIYAILFSGTFALALGAAEAFALWGRRWPPDALLWLAGLLALRLLPMLALRMVPDPAAGDDPLTRRIAFSSMNGALIAAGTAWLLDRLVFGRRDAGTPGRGNAEPGP